MQVETEDLHGTMLVVTKGLHGTMLVVSKDGAQLDTKGLHGITQVETEGLHGPIQAEVERLLGIVLVEMGLRWEAPLTVVAPQIGRGISLQKVISGVLEVRAAEGG
jgi:hypothetical protein